MLAAWQRRLVTCGLCAVIGALAAAPSATATAAATAPVALAGGGFAGYELLADGSVWAWGDDLEGQIGAGGAWQLSTTPVAVHGLANVVALAAGENTGYALERDGDVWAWGDDSQDELGDSGVAPRETPRRVEVPGGVVALAAGGWSAYALRASGTVWAWGDDGWGQLGTPGYAARGAPLPVRGLADVVAVAAGASDGYALRHDGTVWAWGEGALGQLGDGCAGAKRSAHGGAACPASAVAVQVHGLRDVVAIAAGAFTAYALLRDGTIWAWGDDSFGELGAAARHTIAVTPVPVSGLADVVAISAGSYSGYALLRDGSVWDWGRGVDGELGDGSGSNRPVPTRVLKLADVVKLVAGGDMAYAVDEHGRLWAWGSDVYGQLGDGFLQDLNEPTAVLQAGAG